MLPVSKIIFNINKNLIFKIYRFLRNPTELKSIKNISLLRQTISNANNQQASQTTASNSPQVTSTIASLLPQNATSIQHLANALVNVNNLKESYKGHDDDEKPTDLSTSSSINDRGFLPKTPDCYP